ncbi:MAG: hypothetical protein R3284_11465 [Rubricoccaceae bacterium]|nr:hypothetical protein [Rubricoccaceae bacterium]
MGRPSERLILSLGLGLAFASLIFWTALGFARFEMWLPDGLYRAVFILGAVLVLVVILRFAFKLSGNREP